MNRQVGSQAAGAQDQARSWFASINGGRLSAGDQRAFEQWRAASPANDAAYRDVVADWDMLGAMAAEPEIADMRAEALAQGNRQGRWIMAAAVLAAVTVPLVAIQFADVRRDDTEIAASAPPPITARHATGAGETSGILLADGSRVTLNTRSRIEVRLGAEDRRVTLMNGQAWFEVARDARRPFIVSAGDRDTIALGTKFDVRRTAGGVQVTLVEGKVAVQPIVATNPSSRVVLLPGEQIVTGGQGQKVRRVDLIQIADWRSGRVDFRDASVAEAVAELNRYRTLPISYDDPAIGTLRVSGLFFTSDTSGFIEALRLSYGLEAIETRQGVRLMRSRDPDAPRK